MKKYILALGIIAVMFLASCSQETAPENAQVKANEVVQKSNEPSAIGEQNTGESTNPGVKEFDMVVRQWEFAPSTITVDEGDKVVLTIKNEDVDHGFAILELDVNKRLPAGETTIVEFTADKKGEYSFFCSVSCGKGHSSMKGKLIVQ